MTVPIVTPPLSKARRAGDLLFISGQLPRGPDGALTGGDMETQARQALANLCAILQSEGARVDQVIKTTAWISAPEQLAAFNRAYREVFQPPFPARSVVVAGLAAPADVEIEAVAWLG